MTRYQVFRRQRGRDEYVGVYDSREIAERFRQAVTRPGAVGIIRPIHLHGSIADLDQAVAA